MKLIPKREPTATTSWERTEDGQYDVLGDNLHLPVTPNSGPVWTWRPAADTSAVTKNERCFPTKEACLRDLKSHYTPIVTCTCGARNRLPPPYSERAMRAMGKSASLRCAKCKALLRRPS